MDACSRRRAALHAIHSFLFQSIQNTIRPVVGRFCCPPSTISNPFICSYHPINHLVEESQSPRPGHRTCSSALYAHGGRLCEVHGRRIDGKVERREREKLTHSLWIMSSCPCPDDRRRTNKQTTKARLCNPMLGFCSCSLYPFVYFRLLWPFFFFFASNFYCRSSEA